VPLDKLGVPNELPVGDGKACGILSLSKDIRSLSKDLGPQTAAFTGQ
jgi:hypothetical protein